MDWTSTGMKERPVSAHVVKGKPAQLSQEGRPELPPWLRALTVGVM